eukprot:gene17692-21640_t
MRKRPPAELPPRAARPGRSVSCPPPMHLRRILTFCLALAAATSASAATHLDLEYGQAAGVSLRLDAYVPDGPGPHPTVILVHGGGWSGGDKDGGRSKGYMVPMHAPLTAGGFAWFSINYRLAP